MLVVEGARLGLAGSPRRRRAVGSTRPRRRGMRHRSPKGGRSSDHRGTGVTVARRRPDGSPCASGDPGAASASGTASCQVCPWPPGPRGATRVTARPVNRASAAADSSGEAADDGLRFSTTLGPASGTISFSSANPRTSRSIPGRIGRPDDDHDIGLGQDGESRTVAPRRHRVEGDLFVGLRGRSRSRR